VALLDDRHAFVNVGDLGILLGFGKGVVEVGSVAFFDKAVEEGGRIWRRHLI